MVTQMLLSDMLLLELKLFCGLSMFVSQTVALAYFSIGALVKRSPLAVGCTTFLVPRTRLLDLPIPLD